MTDNAPTDSELVDAYAEDPAFLHALFQDPGVICLRVASTTILKNLPVYLKITYTVRRDYYQFELVA